MEVRTNCAGMYGLPKPWYFPFTKSYWCGGSMRSVEECPNPFSFCRRGNNGFLSIIEDDQACAMAHQDPGTVGQEQNLCILNVICACCCLGFLLLLFFVGGWGAGGCLYLYFVSVSCQGGVGETHSLTTPCTSSQNSTPHTASSQLEHKSCKVRKC